VHSVPFKLSGFIYIEKLKILFYCINSNKNVRKLGMGLRLGGRITFQRVQSHFAFNFCGVHTTSCNREKGLVQTSQNSQVEVRYFP